MPWYDYRCPECNAAFSLTLPMSQSASRPKCDCGATAERDFVAEQNGTVHYAGTWPMKSEALGVCPSQIPEAVEQARKLGVPTSFAPDGRAILTGPQHRKRLAEGLGFYDRNGGYGDPRRGLDSRRV